MQQLRIEYMPIQDIMPYSNNPRDNTEAVKLVIASIQAFGFLNPIVVDQKGTIVCGHTRYEAALRLGINQVPTVSTGDLTEQQIQAFRLVDNKVAEIAVWDIPLLDESMDLIRSMDGEQIDMSQFGFLDIPQLVEEEQYEQSEPSEPKDPAKDGKCTCPACGYRFKPTNSQKAQD